MYLPEAADGERLGDYMHPEARRELLVELGAIKRCEECRTFQPIREFTIQSRRCETCKERYRVDRYTRERNYRERRVSTTR